MEVPSRGPRSSISKTVPPQARRYGLECDLCIPYSLHARPLYVWPPVSLRAFILNSCGTDGPYWQRFANSSTELWSLSPRIAWQEVVFKQRKDADKVRTSSGRRQSGVGGGGHEESWL